MDFNIFNNEILSPLNQFDINVLMNLTIAMISIHITNIGLYLTIGTIIIFTISLLGTNYNKISSNNWSISQESLYATINSIVKSQINSKLGQAYFPFIFVLFIFILVNNFIGLIPYSFASTSHFVLTFGLSFSIVLGATILGFFIHGLKFFSLFVPSGCPLALLPLLVIIESISYLARNVSLGLRLAANILSGHMLLNILSGFTFNISSLGIIWTLAAMPLVIFITAFSTLEMGIAAIQAQVFVVLTSGYINDSIDLH